MLREQEKVKRRQRRNERDRVKRRARRIALDTTWWGLVPVWSVKDKNVERDYQVRCSWLKNFINNADNLTMCSCYMCCNKRRSTYFKGDERLTLQERRFNDAIRSYDQETNSEQEE